MKIIDAVKEFISGDWGSDSVNSIENNRIHCLRSADITPIYQNGVSDIVARYVCDKSLKTKTLRVGDIMIEKSGGTDNCSTGRPVYISEDILNANYPLLCSNFCCAIRLKEGFNSLFLYYYLRLVHRNGIFFNFEGKTSGIHNLQLEEAFSAIDLPDYNYDKQCEIAKILSLYDKKIRLNRKSNEVLENLAMQLYDYWFVQFDFPDEQGRPYKSSGGKMVYNEVLKREIPEGWSVLNIFEAVDVLYGFPFSTELFVGEKTSKPIIRIRDILNGTTSAYTNENVEEKYRVKKGDVVIGMDGNFHMNIWHTDKDYLNQRCVRFRQKRQTISSLQVFYSVNPILDLKQNTIKGSTVGHLLNKDVMEMVVIDSHNIKLCECFIDIENQIIANKNIINTLVDLKDFLLPMLMNGQVKMN